MIESQSAEEKVVNAFMGDLEPESQQVNPEQGTTEVEGADAPVAEQQEEVEAKAPEAEQQDGVETIEIDPDEPLFEQELTEEDGKKVAQKLSLKELQQGYLRQRDYTKKTQELARQREELPKQFAKQAQEISESYSKRLDTLHGLVTKTVAAELNGVDFNKLATEDPFRYIELSNRAKQLTDTLAAIEAEQKAEEAKRSEENKKQTDAKRKDLVDALMRDLPSLDQAHLNRLFDTGKEYGFQPQEVNEWLDPRLFKMLNALSDKKTVESKRPEVEKKVAVVTKTLKPGQPAKASNKIQEARSKLRKSGKPEDALAIFEAMV